MFDYSGFDGNLELWTIGVILFIVFTIFRMKKITFIKLTRILDVKVENPTEAIQNTSLLIEIMDKKKYIKSYDILLKGFIFQHEETCEKPSCPLKKMKNMYSANTSNNTNSSSNTISNNTYIDSERALMSSYLNGAYEFYLEK